MTVPIQNKLHPLEQYVPPAPPRPPKGWHKNRLNRDSPAVPPPPPLAPHQNIARRVLRPPPPPPHYGRAAAPKYKCPPHRGPPQGARNEKVKAVGTQNRRNPKNIKNNSRVNLQERYRRRLLRLVNEERMQYGVPPVTLNNTLNACARRHNADLAFLQRRLSHTGVDGAKLSDRLHRCGYAFRYASENVARGQGDPRHVIRSWMRSPGHRRNLLNYKAKQMGVHVGRGKDGRLYWAQLFGSIN